MADNLSIDTNQQQLYYSIRLNNSNNTLHAWMRHILSYLTSNNNNLIINNNHRHRNNNNNNNNRINNNELLGRNELLQEPHVSQGAVCDGSSDCQSNAWIHEVSYEQHYRKLLMSRVNAGDTNHVNSVDQESLRREASLVMESVDPAAPQPGTLNRDQDGSGCGTTNTTTIPAANAVDISTPMDVQSISEHSRYSDWDFVLYDSDVESTDESDASSSSSYQISESDLIKLDENYTSASDEDEDDDESSYEIISSTSLRFDDDEDDEDDDGYSSDSTDRTLKYRRISRNVNADAGVNTNSASSVYEYYYCTSDDDLEYVRSGSEWDMSSSN